MSALLSMLGMQLPQSLRMGDYGLYVWGSFGAFALFLLWDALVPALRRRRLLRRQALRMRREAARAGTRQRAGNKTAASAAIEPPNQGAPGEAQ